MEVLKNGGAHWASLQDPTQRRFWVELPKLHRNETALLRCTLCHDQSLVHPVSNIRQPALQMLRAACGATQLLWMLHERLLNIDAKNQPLFLAPTAHIHPAHLMHPVMVAQAVKICFVREELSI